VAKQWVVMLAQLAPLAVFALKQMDGLKFSIRNALLQSIVNQQRLARLISPKHSALMEPQRKKPLQHLNGAETVFCGVVCVLASLNDSSALQTRYVSATHVLWNLIPRIINFFQ